MGFEPIQNFFPGAIQNLGLQKTFTAIQICHKFQDLLPKLFTLKEAQKNISAKSYKNKTLNIGVSSSLWAQEVSMRKEEIIRELNAEFGRGVIAKIKTELINTPSRLGGTQAHIK